MYFFPTVPALVSLGDLFQAVTRREVRRIKQTTVVSAVENLLARIKNLVFQEGSWFEQIVNY